MIKSINKRDFLQNIKNGKDNSYWLQGLIPEARAYGVFLLQERLNSPCLYLIPEQKKAESMYQDLKNFLPGEVFLLPYRKKTTALNPSHLLYLLDKEKKPVLVSSVRAAVQTAVPLDLISSRSFLIKKNTEIQRDTLTRWLVKGGYQPSPLVENEGEYAVRGGIVDIYPPASSKPVRIEFFADKVESIREFEPATQRSIKKLEQFLILPSNGLDTFCQDNLQPFIQTVPKNYHFILDEPLDIAQKLKKMGHEKEQNIIEKRVRFYISTLPQNTGWTEGERKILCHSSPLSFYRGDLELLSKDIRKWQEKDYNVTIMTPTSQQAKRFQELLQERGLEPLIRESFNHRSPEESLVVTLGDIKRGFILQEAREVMVSDADIFRRYSLRRRKKRASFEEKIKTWSELKQGDYVVHIDYGIGKFKGLVSLKIRNQWGDYFQVDYKGSDRLYIPFNQLDRLHKYVGDSSNPPPLHTLEGAGWELTKKRVRKATRELASSLLKLYSIRKAKPGHSFSPDTPWQLKFEASFPYEETPDQSIAIGQVKQDMESPTAMDRLICGDSGYGKTEVAIRASFKVVMDNKQVAVLVPTTILADQHLRTFSERIGDFPVRVEMLSRFQSPKKQREIIKHVKEGKVDIIIGTHRLLQNDVKFKDIGLVIIDEEHKFGVRQKKKLKDLRETVDTLTLSATPIPRSLYMALTGIYRLSTIFSTPPERKNVEIRIAPYQDKIAREAILQELSRGGQVFYLHNRVRGIQKITNRLEEMLPQVKIAVAHGQMPSFRLEKTIIDFIKGKYEVLVCTSIIESGIDMPNVNTLIVENPEQFGLADLYQIRGRVGRGRKKGYTYLLYHPTKTLTEQAKRRLQAIHQFKGPGAGFKIAMEDLQIRGAGNLLGKEQHGHIASVGFTLYSQLLAEEVKKLKGEKVKPSFPFNMNLDIEARIPPSFVSDKTQRMLLYQKIGEIRDEKKLLDFKEELKDRFGPLPSPARKLIHLLHIKLTAQKLGVCSINKNSNNMIKLSFSSCYPLTPEKKEKLTSVFGNQIKTFSQDEENILISKPAEKNEEKFLAWLTELLQKLKDVLII